MVIEVDIELIARQDASDTFPIKEIVSGFLVVRKIRFHEWSTIRAVPVDGAVGLHDAIAIAVVSVIDTSGGDEVIFRIIAVGNSGGGGNVARRIIALIGQLVFGCGGGS